MNLTLQVVRNTNLVKTGVVETFVDVITARDTSPTNTAAARHMTVSLVDTLASATTRRTDARIDRCVTRGSGPAGRTVAGEGMEIVDACSVVEAWAGLTVVW